MIDWKKIDRIPAGTVVGNFNPPERNIRKITVKREVTRKGNVTRVHESATMRSGTNEKRQGERLARVSNQGGGFRGCPCCGAMGGALRKMYEPEAAGCVKWCYVCGWTSDKPAKKRKGLYADPEDRARMFGRTRERRRTELKSPPVYIRRIA